MNEYSVSDRSTQRLTKGATTRANIKAAAKRSIAIDGFAGVKVADIMAAAGKSPGAFYLYFKRNEALLLESLEDFQQRLRLEVNAPNRAGEEPAAHLVKRWRSFWCYREDRPIATAAFQMSMVDKQFARAWHNVRQQGIRGFAEVSAWRRRTAAVPGLTPSWSPPPSPR